MPFCTRRSLRATQIQNESGLTMIEMIAALSLLLLLLTVLTQFLYNSTQTKAKMDSAYDRQHLIKNVYMTLSADISPLVKSLYLPENALVGDDYQMSFWQEGKKGLYQVNYRYDPYEQKVYRSIGYWGSKPLETVLFTGITNWKIEYYLFKNKNWQVQWKPTRKDEIPAMVRIQIKTKNMDLGSMVIPIDAWYNEEIINEF